MSRAQVGGRDDAGGRRARERRLSGSSAGRGLGLKKQKTGPQIQQGLSGFPGNPAFRDYLTGYAAGAPWPQAAFLHIPEHENEPYERRHR